MKHSRFLALILALAMVFALAGCGSDAAGSASSTSASASGSAGSAGSASGSSSASDSSSAEPDVEVPAEAEADVVSYLTDGALAATDVVATVGDTQISAAELFYLVAYNHLQLSANSYNYGAALDLTADTGDGVTVADFLFNVSMESMVSYVVGMNKAVADGVSLSEENTAALASLLTDNITGQGESQWNNQVSAGLIKEEDFTEEEKAAWIQEQGENLFHHSMMYFATTEDGYQNFYNTFYHYSALQESLFGEGGANAPTDETIADYLQSYIADNGLLWGRCILFSTRECTTDEERAEVKAQADEAYAALSALSGDELREKFTEFQSQYDGSGYTAGEVQRYASSDPLVDGYYSGLAALAPGEIAMTEELGTTTESYGYFILLREADDTESLRSTAENEYIQSTFNAMVTQWRDETDVSYSDAYTNLDRLAFFERLSSLQNALYLTNSVS